MKDVELRGQVFILALAVLILGIAVLLLAVRPSATARNAPTPPQGGLGRPETPGVAPTSTPSIHDATAEADGAAVSSVDRTPIPPVAFARTNIGNAAGAIRGTARWFATGPNGVAAAGPRLRAALGSHWRGTLVGITYRGKTVWARLSDWCACGSGSIIDLPDEVFARFAPLSRGVLAVTVHWGDVPRLPATDAAP